MVRNCEVVEILLLSDGSKIAYQKGDGEIPGVIFIHGLSSNMESHKASILADWYQRTSQEFIRFDYFGHGQSYGSFYSGTIGRWVQDTINILDHLTRGPQILIGSSIGGWISLLVALQRPERVVGLVATATTADFTEVIVWQQLSLVQQEGVIRCGLITLSTTYGSKYCYINWQLIREGRYHLILLSNYTAVQCPVHLIHGQKDLDVPWQLTLAIQEKLTASSIITTIIKDGNHQLSRERDTTFLIRAVSVLLNSFIR